MRALEFVLYTVSLWTDKPKVYNKLKLDRGRVLTLCISTLHVHDIGCKLQPLRGKDPSLNGEVLLPPKRQCQRLGRGDDIQVVEQLGGVDSPVDDGLGVDPQY